MRGRRHGLVLNQRSTKISILSADMNKKKSQLKYLACQSTIQSPRTIFHQLTAEKKQHHDARQRKTFMI